MKNIIIVISTLFTIGLFGQDLNCDDFKSGDFIGTTPTYPNVQWKVIRQGNEQIDMVHKIPKEYIEMGFPLDTLYSRITWIDECNYRLTYDDNKVNLNESQKETNQNGGIYTELIKIEGNCFYYKSKFTIQNEEFIHEGKICKE